MSTVGPFTLDGGGRCWETLSHNGVLFPPPYVPHRIPVLYEGQPVSLSPEAEEAATLYAKYLETDYIKSPIFRRNFWRDWKPMLRETPIRRLELVDFRPLYEHLLATKVAPDREARAQEEAPYRQAIVDGEPQPVGIIRMEAPGIFLGRGCSPHLGKLKPRIWPEDVTLNLGEMAPIPPTLPGHQWGAIVHEHECRWLASWKDRVTGKTKYVYLGDAASQKGVADQAKYDLARRLRPHIRAIRREVRRMCESGDRRQQATGIAIWLLDTLALRLGNNRETGAGTVGITSLKVSQIWVAGTKLQLDFLGKDSVRYQNTVAAPAWLREAVLRAAEGKSEDQILLSATSSTEVNGHLQGYLPGLSGKVFRTYNASSAFQELLDRASEGVVDVPEGKRAAYLIAAYQSANGKVALLCNHRKDITKSTTEATRRLRQRLREAREKVKSTRAGTASRTQAEARVERLRSQLALRRELQNASLGTSKASYLDPRITVAYAHRHGIPIARFYTAALQRRFAWAMETPADYSF